MRLTLGYKEKKMQGEPQRLLRRLPLAIVLLPLVTACGLGASSNTQTHGSGDVRHEKLVTDIHVNDARKIAKPASSDEGFRTETPQTSIGSDSGKALPPPGVMSSQSGTLVPKGLKVGNLFNENLRSEDDRLDRLEGSVQDIHNYVAGISPSIDRLVAIESDIQDLVGQLEVLLDDDPQPSMQQRPVVQAKAPVMTKSSPSKPPVSIVPTKNNFGLKAIARIRASTSPAKTRVVLDLSEKMNFSYDLDNDLGVLTLVFPDAQSSSVTASALSKTKLFKEVTSTPQDGGGYVIALALSRDVAVINEGKIGITNSNPMYRVYLDLK